MNKTELSRIIRDITSKYGFKYCKNRYYCETEDLIIVIDLQKSSYDNSYYINYGFCVKEIHDGLFFPKCNECDATSRFINSNNKDIYQLENLCEEDADRNIESNIDTYIAPVINGGIGKYFELFPQYICIATLKLKNYLGLK